MPHTKPAPQGYLGHYKERDVEENPEEHNTSNLDLKIAIRSINHVADQLCTARDDSYHRARAEAERDAYLKVIKEMYRGLLDEIMELKG